MPFVCGLPYFHFVVAPFMELSFRIFILVFIFFLCLLSVICFLLSMDYRLWTMDCLLSVFCFLFSMDYGLLERSESPPVSKADLFLLSSLPTKKYVHH